MSAMTSTFLVLFFVCLVCVLFCFVGVVVVCCCLFVCCCCFFVFFTYEITDRLIHVCHMVHGASQITNDT